MTSQSRIMLPDADVIIAAHRNYYAPDICPGFWDSIDYHLKSGRLLVIDRVRDEIIDPPMLVQWLRRVPKGAFVTTKTSSVGQVYRQIMDWVRNNTQFSDAAKDEFARGADGWLVAYAKVHDMDIVTNEVLDHSVKRKVKLPNVCQQFEVVYRNTYDMLRELGAKFNWKDPLL